MFGWLFRWWDERVSYEGGLSLMLMEALLIVPLIMAAFFYPWAALATAAGVGVLMLVVYKGIGIWNRRHRVGS